jgi:DNA (cytosine-5)-methyltransferase 1
MLGRYAISDTLKIGSLCTGYGGLDMAVEAYFNAKTAWVSEIDKYASKVIDARINKPNIGDLKIVNWAEIEPVDIITAGYPCQPFSTAGSRKGEADERHLWPYIKQAISSIRPSIVFLENVRGHFTLGFRDVLTDLASIGYDVRWSIVRASDVGAPHRRERLFILAYLQCTDPYGQRLTLGENYSGTQGNKRESQFIASKLVTAITDSPSAGLQGRINKGRVPTKYSDIWRRAVPSPLVAGTLNPQFVEYLMGLPLGYVTDLDLSKSQKLKILGNGVVPQQAYRALELLCNINSYPQGLKTCGQHAEAPRKLSTI